MRRGLEFRGCLSGLGSGIMQERCGKQTCSATRSQFLSLQGVRKLDFLQEVAPHILPHAVGKKGPYFWEQPTWKSQSICGNKRLDTSITFKTTMRNYEEDRRSRNFLESV